MYNNQRTAYGQTLLALGKENDKVVVLDADLCGSAMTRWFEDAYPERHFEMGIAEANMVSTAAGLAQTGLIPFANTFSVFLSGRAYDQIRQTICIGKLNVKFCGSSAGMSDFGDGATHQAIEDIALMRAIPNMTVICPADANETVQATRAIAAMHGPCYLRLNRNDYENVTAENEPFEIGVPKVLRKGNEVAVFATGVMCLLAMEAAKRLEGRVSVKVINVHTLKPLNEQIICDLAQECNAVVTAEEHSVIGGLGSAIACALRKQNKPIEFVGVQDEFGSSAHSYQDVMCHYGLTADNIERVILKIVKE